MRKACLSIVSAFDRPKKEHGTLEYFVLSPRTALWTWSTCIHQKSTICYFLFFSLFFLFFGKGGSLVALNWIMFRKSFAFEKLTRLRRSRWVRNSGYFDKSKSHRNRQLHKFALKKNIRQPIWFISRKTSFLKLKQKGNMKKKKRNKAKSY